MWKHGKFISKLNIVCVCWFMSRYINSIKYLYNSYGDHKSSNKTNAHQKKKRGVIAKTTIQMFVQNVPLLMGSYTAGAL